MGKRKKNASRADFINESAKILMDAVDFGMSDMPNVDIRLAMVIFTVFQNQKMVRELPMVEQKRECDEFMELLRHVMDNTIGVMDEKEVSGE